LLMDIDLGSKTPFKKKGGTDTEALLRSINQDLVRMKANEKLVIIQKKAKKAKHVFKAEYKKGYCIVNNILKIKS